MAGLLLVASAIGLFANKVSGDGDVRFKPPGKSTYAGPKRTDNGPDISIPRALIPPVIDANLSDWQGAQPGPYQANDVTFRKVGRDWHGPDDLSGSFYFAWDDTNFYVAATITDNLHVQTARTRGYDLYKGDDIELSFDTDLAGDFAVSEANADDYQLGLSPGDFAGLTPEAVFWNPDRSDARNALVRVAAQPRTDKAATRSKPRFPGRQWACSVPIPAARLALPPLPETTTSATPPTGVMTSIGPRLQYRQPFTFGNLLF